MMTVTPPFLLSARTKMYCLLSRRQTTTTTGRHRNMSTSTTHSSSCYPKYTPMFNCSWDDGVDFQEIPKLSPLVTSTTYTTTSTTTKSAAADIITLLSFPGSMLRTLTNIAFTRINHLLRPSHIKQLSRILTDNDSTTNDRYVAMQLLKNANISAGMVLPGCQDTGTAIVVAKKGDKVMTDGEDSKWISQGVYDAYTQGNLRYSQVSPLSMFDEANTKSNLPAQIDLFTSSGSEYLLMFVAKGGGSANKTFLYQQTKSVLNEASLYKFLDDKIKTIGTSACPPYHLAIVIGGLSAELTMKTVKLASCHYLDYLPTAGTSSGTAFRDLEWEQRIHTMCQEMGIGAQFGGKYFCHDVRVIRLPRHGASCPIGIGVSCSADRQVLAKITASGVFMEVLEENPAQYMPEVSTDQLGDHSLRIDMRGQPMSAVLSELSKLEVSTRVLLTGSLIVMRDIAHAKINEQLQTTGKLPSYVIDHPIYYAGPAKTPTGYNSGSFGPTTAGRMDSYVETFMKHGGSKITLAKGNRSKQVVKACEQYGGFYLGSIGGPAALLAVENIKNVEAIDFVELGMEAVWKIEVEDFPAFVVIDDKGNDFFKKWLG
eukprot:GHVS01091979.1.p1 GENE.GHVS01091979.1~~GHVS01091979.1.p1  ORF type:complete len:598 (+),score=96.48 GHVS01091979.1:32-1825(+)